MTMLGARREQEACEDEHGTLELDDLILLNLEIAEIRQFIESGLIHTWSDLGQTELSGIYV